MMGYKLPTSLNVGGVVFSIRTDYRQILGIFEMLNDPGLDERFKTLTLLRIFYEKWEEIPQQDINEAVKKAYEFMDCGQVPKRKIHPKLVDWEQDAPLIISAVNKISHMEIRSVPYMHWWTFFGYYMEIGESLFSNIVSYRSNRAKHKKQEKWEKEFYKENKHLIDFKIDLSEEDRKKKDSLEKWL